MRYAADRANQIGRRTEERFPTRIASVIAFGDKQAFGVIEDLSANVAKIEARSVPMLGERVVFVGVALDVSGTVAWQKGDRCGVRFDTPICPCGGQVERSYPHRIPANAGLGRCPRPSSHQ